MMFDRPMGRRPHRRLPALLSVGLVIGALALSVVPAAAAPGGQANLAAARNGTAPYHSLAAAQAAGWNVEVADAAGITCITDLADVPSEGNMGIHYLNPGQIPELVALLNGVPFTGVASVDARTPEALIYQPGSNGQMRLVGAEYLTLKADWDKDHAAAPELFGQMFMSTGAGNRYGLPAFYSLHVWLWYPNPNGMFAMWNPRVSCP